MVVLSGPKLSGEPKVVVLSGPKLNGEPKVVVLSGPKLSGEPKVVVLCSLRGTIGTAVPFSAIVAGEGAVPVGEVELAGREMTPWSELMMLRKVVSGSVKRKCILEVRLLSLEVIGGETVVGRLLCF